jgi:hypothetical protein
MPSHPSDSTVPDVAKWYYEYYLNPQPDEVPRALAAYRAAGAFADEKYYWQLLGFLAELFALHAGRLPRWLHDWASYSVGDQKFVFEAVWLSGSSEAQTFLETVGTRRLQELCGQDFRATPPPSRDAIPPSSHPGALDFYWGRFFATGDDELVRRIIACLSLSRETPTVPGGMVDIGPRLIVDAASWSLGVNARHHRKVREICQAEMMAQCGATRQLLEEVVREADRKAAELSVADAASGTCVSLIDQVVSPTRDAKRRRRWWQFWK